MEKNTLKQFFRSGSRPTQDQFYALIDACYNTPLSSAVSGYTVIPSGDEDMPLQSKTMRGGATTIVPSFEQINKPLSRSFHYAIPLVNMPVDAVLTSIDIKLRIPDSKKYVVRHNNRDIEINQIVDIDAIQLFNGKEEVYTFSAKDNFLNGRLIKELEITQQIWEAVHLDIAISYMITSKIAVSDQFKLSELKPDMLQHVFGGVTLQFKKIIR